MKSNILDYDKNMSEYSPSVEKAQNNTESKRFDELLEI